MKWNKKYNYPSSTRSIYQGHRHYALNSQMLPSVTSIIEMTKTDREKESLASWKQRVGEKESAESRSYEPVADHGCESTSQGMTGNVNRCIFEIDVDLAGDLRDETRVISAEDFDYFAVVSVESPVNPHVLASVFVEIREHHRDHRLRFEYVKVGFSCIYDGEYVFFDLRSPDGEEYLQLDLPFARWYDNVLD